MNSPKEFKDHEGITRGSHSCEDCNDSPTYTELVHMLTDAAMRCAELSGTSYKAHLCMTCAPWRNAIARVYSNAPCPEGHTEPEENCQLCNPEAKS